MNLAHLSVIEMKSISVESDTQLDCCTGAWNDYDIESRRIDQPGQFFFFFLKTQFRTGLVSSRSITLSTLSISLELIWEARAFVLFLNSTALFECCDICRDLIQLRNLICVKLNVLRAP